MAVWREDGAEQKRIEQVSPQLAPIGTVLNDRV